jgi:hypothetical protein
MNNDSQTIDGIVSRLRDSRAQKFTSEEILSAARSILRDLAASTLAEGALDPLRALVHELEVFPEAT